jgi:succinate dehydrogenase/fumarate reductase flavoprotein subunit
MANRCATDVDFFIEYFALDLIMDERTASAGASLPGGSRTARCTASARKPWCSPLAAMAALIFSCTECAHPALATAARWLLRAGLPLQDMEFVQFHPDRHLSPPVASSPKARAARAAISPTRTASASWSATRPP